MERGELAAIVKTIVVRRPASEAFDLFVTHISAWWPLQTHSMAAQGGGPAATSVLIEAFVGGRVYETRADGGTCEWGKVLVFEPGTHLRLLWQLGRAPEAASEVSVCFEALSDSSCRVKLVHAHWERLGEAAMDVRQAYQAGWEIVLGKLFAQYADNPD
jgi:hypothetical protein